MEAQTGSATPPTELERSADAADDSLDSGRALLAGARPGPPIAAPLARARVLGAMFGDHGTAGTVGRFRVLGRLGAGGMGVVYEAYDPDLARGVALKLINVSAHDRDAALAEAQALARLSHPNVVPIHDFGLERDHVYLVMELVRGKTLGQWSEGRVLREILAVYQQAGTALAAAHAAGLVHRDFKPANAIVGADGRLRVVDFGLACEADDPERAAGPRRRAGGTPRFMAPEIKAGTAITPAADQYSFCVALAEALERARAPVPRRITAALARGRAVDPAARFGSMAELLRVLARDPARTRRRAAAIGGLVVGVGALAFLAGSRAPGDAAERCGDGTAELEAAWSAAARSAALNRLAALGSDGRALRAKLEADLGGYARSWAHGYHLACIDRRRGVESDAMSDRRTICLKHGLDALAAVGELATSAGSASRIELPRAVQSLPDPAACSNVDALALEIPPPPPALAAQIAQARHQVAQAEMQIAAGRHDQALATARSAVADARRLPYDPVLAEALLVQGHAQMSLDRRAAAPLLQEAIRVANHAHHDAVAVEAWARLVYVRGTSTEPNAASSEIDFVESFVERAPPAAFGLALAYNNLGAVALGAGRRVEARDYFAREREASRPVTGRGALELVKAGANLALATEDRAQADKIMAATIAALTERLGDNHPDTLEIRELRGFTTVEDLAQAENLLTPVCTGYEQYPGLPDTAECWFEVAMLRWDLGACDAARAALARVTPGSDEAARAAAYLALLDDPRAAARQFAVLVAAHPPAPHEPTWTRESRAMLRLGLGRAFSAAGDARGAHDALVPALADLELHARAHPGARFERYAGRAQVALAFAIRALPGGRDDASPARAAIAWLARVGGPASAITALQAEPPKRSRPRTTTSTTTVESCRHMPR